MTLDELLRADPELQELLRHMPEGVRRRHTIKTFPPNHIIHHKYTILQSFGVVCRGEHRVVNEFENGNIFMIEKNEAISFIGEVTILAEEERTSVTIETLTECVVLFFSIEDFEYWIANDIDFLRFISGKIAKKLYRSSYNRGARLFYSAKYLLLKYILEYAKSERMEEKERVVVRKTRSQLYEETGMTVKTLNRAIAKLRGDGLISIDKGKILMTTGQYRLASEKAGIYLKENKKGSIDR